jgi:hypothetical protein
MSNVINLFEKNEQTGTGEAFCFQCKHEWIAVSATGVIQLECPSCHTLKGLYKFPFNISEGQLARVCNCGNDLFYLTPEGHLCPNCGLYQSY